MLRLAYRQLTANLPRTALTVAVIGAVIAVVLVLEGFEQGLYAQLRQSVLRRGGDLIVAQAGVTSMIASRSVLRQLTRQEVESVPGVRAAHPLTSIPIIYNQDGRKTPIFLFVYDTAGGPRGFVAGSAPRDEHGIVIDESLALRYGLAPGDPFVVSGYRFRVDGITSGTSALFTAFAYTTYDGLLEYYFKADLAGDIATFPLLSFLLIDLQPGVDRSAVTVEIKRAVPDVDVFTPAQMADNDEKIGRTLFGPILQLLVGVGYVTGALTVGLFMFASVDARTRDFGVLKAVGFRGRALFAAVLAEAAATTLLAVPLGAALALVLAEVIESAAPLYVVLPLEPVPVLRTIGAAAAFAALGALAPVRTIARIEPALVFRS